uniref:PS II complex 12 kDa extrinsic protein n=1 Tax=Leptocylindrus danicus TaxID=163516 RepID=A0A7S2KE42_9STRA
MKHIRTCIISLFGLLPTTIVAFSVGSGRHPSSVTKCAFSPRGQGVAHNVMLPTHFHQSLQMSPAYSDSNNDIRTKNSGLFGKMVQIRQSVMQNLQKLLTVLRLRQSLQAFVVAAALFFAAPNMAQASSSTVAAVSGSATATKMVSTTAAEQPGYLKLPGGKSYVQKYMFNDDEYNPFEAGMREEPGDIFYNDGAVSGRSGGKAGSSRGAGGGMSGAQMKMYRSMLMKILPAVSIPLVAPRIWKIITNFSEILTYGKDAVANTSYDATEKKSDEDGGSDDDDDDDEDEDWYDPNNPDGN